MDSWSDEFARLRELVEKLAPDEDFENPVGEYPPIDGEVVDGDPRTVGTVYVDVKPKFGAEFDELGDAIAERVADRVVAALVARAGSLASGSLGKVLGKVIAGRLAAGDKPLA